MRLNRYSIEFRCVLRKTIITADTLEHLEQQFPRILEMTLLDIGQIKRKIFQIILSLMFYFVTLQVLKKLLFFKGECRSFFKNQLHKAYLGYASMMCRARDTICG